MSGEIAPELVDLITRLIAGGPTDRPPVIGIAGAQGSGKTTLARTAAKQAGGVQVSLDDVYLTKDERAGMAALLHPLFVTRGPPGTHDLSRLRDVIFALSCTGPISETPLPSFDKRSDDRRAEADWPVFRGRPRAILVDGWCLGATAEDERALMDPINALERFADADGRWRRAVNGFVAGPYAAFAGGLDAVVFLKAPAFDIVLDWRCEQEAELLGVAPEALPEAHRTRIADFVAYFERVTRRMLAGGVKADVTVALDHKRRVVSL